MHVLQTPFGVVRHVHTEIRLVPLVPGGGNVLDRKIAVDERFFQFVADHHVDRVGQLVGLAAVQSRLRRVDGKIEFLFRNVGESPAADLLDQRIEVVYERRAPPDIVFIEARDRLVHSGRHIVGDVFGVVFFGLVLHEQGVPALVQSGEDIRDKVVFVVMRRDTDVVRSVVIGEGVLGGREHQRGAAQPFKVEDRAREPLLLFDRNGAGEEIGADRPSLFPDPFDKRQDPLFQGGEKPVELRNTPAGLVVVEQRVVGRGILFVAERDALSRQVDDLFKRRGETREIRRLLRREPRRVGAGFGKTHAVGEGGRNVLLLFVFAPEHLDRALLPVGEPLRIIFEGGQERHVALGVRKGKEAPTERRHIFPRLIHSLFGTGTFEVEVQFADRAIVGVGFVQDLG